MRRIITILAGLLLTAGLIAATPAPEAQAQLHHASAHPDAHKYHPDRSRPHHVIVFSDSAKTTVTWINQGYTGCGDSGGCRWMSVKCHDGPFANQWHQLFQGSTSLAACGGTGWIERTWVDADVFLVVRNDKTGVKTAYLPGCNCQIGGGSYNIWLQHV